MARSLCLVLLVAAPTSAGSRNVLLITSDDQGLDLGAYGNKLVRTPNIDRLAARGTLFTQGFATVSSCTILGCPDNPPSMAMKRISMQIVRVECRHRRALHGEISCVA